LITATGVHAGERCSPCTRRFHPLTVFPLYSAHQDNSGLCQSMNPWIYEIVENIDQAGETELLKALDELEFLYEALSDIDRDIAEGLIARLNEQLERLRKAP
jgi:hypothetical protein